MRLIGIGVNAVLSHGSKEPFGKGAWPDGLERLHVQDKEPIGTLTFRRGVVITFRLGALRVLGHTVSNGQGPVLSSVKRLYLALQVSGPGGLLQGGHLEDDVGAHWLVSGEGCY